MITAILSELAANTVQQQFLERAKLETEQQFGDPIYKLACSIIQSMLDREQSNPATKGMLLHFLNSAVLKKSVVIYACSI